MKKPAPKPLPKPPAPPPGRRWLLAAMLCLLIASITWAVFEFIVWNRLPANLVGTWEVTDGPEVGSVVEFHRSGKMIGHVNQNGNLSLVRAMVRVEGNKLYSTTWHPTTGQEMTTEQTIQTMTARNLVLADKKGTVLNFRRVND
ncbi:MAG TPA: hypothetical protein VFE62_30205 [Gemmataceae bacterium]|nr:hypothetical protein [Gemmataceae bacterium]